MRRRVYLGGRLMLETNEKPTREHVTGVLKSDVKPNG